MKRALERVPGVVEAKAEFTARSAAVRYDPDKTSLEALAKAVTNAGFQATPRK